MKNHIYTPQDEFKVLVRCFTYNQSQFISDTLNGFASQETNFPFVCLVMDDCSTDGEQGVIRAWMERECDMTKAEYIELEFSRVILVPHKSNQYCTFVFYLLMKNLYHEMDIKWKMVTPWREHCKYESICEGDDYWIDKFKLQKQIDILDNNSNISLCYGKYININEDGERIDRDLFNFYQSLFHSGDILPDMFKLNYILTCTTCFRIDIFKSEFFLECGGILDCAYFFSAGFMGDFYYDPSVLSAYRMNTRGLTLSNHDAVDRAYCKVYTHAAKYFSEGKGKKVSLFKAIKIRYHIMVAAIHFHHSKQNTEILGWLLKNDKRYYFYGALAMTKKMKDKILILFGCAPKYPTF